MLARLYGPDHAGRTIYCAKYSEGGDKFIILAEGRYLEWDQSHRDGVGDAIRNPIAHPERFLRPRVIERRIDRFAGKLGLDRTRMLEWSFAQAVLAAIWEIEDCGTVDATKPFIALAQTLQSLRRVKSA